MHCPGPVSYIGSFPYPIIARLSQIDENYSRYPEFRASAFANFDWAFTVREMKPQHSLSAVVLVIIAATTLRGQDAYTNPLGYVRLQTLPTSDTIVACPLERQPEFSGKVASITANVVAVDGNPTWTGGQFQFTEGSQPKIYHARFTSGALAGSYFTVLGNSNNSLTLDLNGTTLDQAVAGDGLTLTAYWSIGALFPATDAGVSFEISPSVFARRTEVLVPDQAAVGINHSAIAIYFFYAGAWRKIGAPITTSFNNTAALLPDSWIIVRNRGFSGSLCFLGSVLKSAVRIDLNSTAGAKQDNIVALTRPIDVTLDASGLIASGAFRSSTNATTRTDELFVFDNTASGINKSAAATYFYYGGGWRKVGQSLTTNFGTDPVFKAGQGVVVRKGANGIASLTNPWVNIANY